MTQLEKTEAAIDALPEHHEVNSDVIEIAHDLARKLDACAAGEWRTDLKNAPRDGSKVLCEFTTGEVVAKWVKDAFDGQYWLTEYHKFYVDADLRAFSVLTPRPRP